MIIGVKDVEYIREYIIKVTFDNNESKIVDLKNFIEGEIFEPLKEIDYFRNVRVDEDIETVCWDNGADFSPEFLYETGV
ncbi:MAG: DUF2442 domain-containing protein [Fusobacteria bacterium]|nr:DUF2442 domain-containing protein [Fusobacteriota bacterium]